jgi:AcrR family transcriptional regulator
VTIDTAAQRTSRGPYAKTTRTRGAILDAALSVFAQNGYRSGSLKSVAEEVGMSEAGLLHHFPNKSALLAAVLERRDDRTRERFAFDPSDGRSVMRDFAELAEYNASIPGVVELFCTLSAEATAPDHPAHSYFLERYEISVRMAREAFETLRDQGELAAGVEPDSAARTVIALMDGLQIQWLMDRDSVDMAHELRLYFSSILTEAL